MSGSESADRKRAMLRTAMGPAIAAALADPLVNEVMVNPDGALRLDRLGSGRSDTGERLDPARIEGPSAVANPDSQPVGFLQEVDVNIQWIAHKISQSFFNSHTLKEDLIKGCCYRCTHLVVVSAFFGDANSVNSFGNLIGATSNFSKCFTFGKTKADVKVSA